MVLIATTLLALAHPASADQYTDKIRSDRQQQQQINGEIASLKAQIAAAQDQEAALEKIIAGLDVQIAESQAQVAAAKQRLSEIDASLAAARADLQRARVQLAAKKQQLAKAVVVIYEIQQQSTPLNNLLTSDDFNAFWTGVINGRRISDQELQMVADIHHQEDVVTGDVANIQQQQVQQQGVVADLYSAELQLDQQRGAQQVALNYLQRLQAHDQLLAQQWQAAYNALNSQIAHLQVEEKRALAAGGGSGRFVWPDTGPISQGFGCTPFVFEAYDPSCSTLHFHNGIDIAGACGNDIVAADAGIAYIQPFQGWGFGNYIIIVHGNGWQTLYGHMSGFAVNSGQTVHRGQLIGWEGTTGNSTGCHLHFGVNHNGVWVNPLAYLG